MSSADSNMLAVNGDHILNTKVLAKNMLHRMGFVKCRASADSVEDFEEKREWFLLDIKAAVN